MAKRSMLLSEIAKLNTLYRKWVSFDGKTDIERIYQCIQHEYQNARKGVIKVSPQLLTEIRGELNYVGRIRNSLNKVK